MAVEYSLDDVSLLVGIRSDVLARPTAYAEGEAFLRTQYGPERLRQNVMAEWERWKDHPTTKAMNRAAAQEKSGGIVDPAQYEARFQEVLEQLSAPPQPEQWSLAACASQAIQELSESRGEHHDTKAQAVLLLAVMLWDADADKHHSIFALFGPWGVTPTNQIESISRWAATYFLANEADFRHWMDTVKMAWMALSKPTAVGAADAAMGEGKHPTPTTSPVSQHAAAVKNRVELRSWTRTDLDNAIRKYKADRSASYTNLVDAVKKNKSRAKENARKVYGRNAIARALGVRSYAMVGESPVWLAIAQEMGFALHRERRAQGTRQTQRPSRIGHDIAVDEKSARPEVGADNAPAHEPLETAEHQETIRKINTLAQFGNTTAERAKNHKAAEALHQKWQRGECTDEQVREIVQMTLNPND